jgi:hypothetical protein
VAVGDVLCGRWDGLRYHFIFYCRTIMSLGFHCFESAVADVGKLWLKLWSSVCTH